MTRSVRRLVKRTQTVALDLRFGGLLGGSEPTRYAHLGAKDVSSTDYAMLPSIFPAGSIRPDDVLVDVGCGKGRVIQWWLHSGCRNRIVGLELDPDVAANTARRLRRFTNVEIRTGDAVANLPADGTVFYLANPFARPVVERFADRLLADVQRPQRVRTYYLIPVHIDVFEMGGPWEVRHTNATSPWFERPLSVVTLRH